MPKVTSWKKAGLACKARACLSRPQAVLPLPDSSAPAQLGARLSRFQALHGSPPPTPSLTPKASWTRLLRTPPASSPPGLGLHRTSGWAQAYSAHTASSLFRPYQASSCSPSTAQVICHLFLKLPLEHSSPLTRWGLSLLSGSTPYPPGLAGFTAMSLAITTDNCVSGPWGHGPSSHPSLLETGEEASLESSRPQSVSGLTWWRPELLCRAASAVHPACAWRRVPQGGRRNGFHL